MRKIAKEMKAPDKVTQKMTRSGAVSENLTTGEISSISERQQEESYAQAPTATAEKTVQRIDTEISRHSFKKAAKKAQREIQSKKNYYCSDRACGFVMWKNDRFFTDKKKVFTKAIAAALLKDGKVKVKGMVSTRTGKPFDGVVLLADTGGKYVNYRIEQNRK